MRVVFFGDKNGMKNSIFLFFFQKYCGDQNIPGSRYLRVLRNEESRRDNGSRKYRGYKMKVQSENTRAKFVVGIIKIKIDKSMQLYILINIHIVYVYKGIAKYFCRLQGYIILYRRNRVNKFSALIAVLRSTRPPRNAH